MKPWNDFTDQKWVSAMQEIGFEAPDLLEKAAKEALMAALAA
jgi:hypothetical protein